MYLRIADAENRWPTRAIMIKVFYSDIDKLQLVQFSSVQLNAIKFNLANNHKATLCPNYRTNLSVQRRLASSSCSLP